MLRNTPEEIWRSRELTARDLPSDKKILIPLTSSLYVPGRIKDTENVIVDVGTGYYVEKVASFLWMSSQEFR